MAVRLERLPWWVAAVFALLAFAHAALWGQIVPLWQIPDEAAHFEYAHLLVKLRRRPTLDDVDLDVQARILRSMWEHNYWEYLGFRRPEQPPRRVLPGGWTAGGAIPDTAVVGDAYVGAFSQLQNPTPVYYALLAPVQALVMQQPIDEQLRALRWASRVIFAIGVMFIVLTAGEIFQWRTWPTLTAGTFVALHPMFNYIGSGVNNDNGVMMFASAATWQLARGWRRGYTLWRLVLIAVLVVLALQAKRTAAFLVLWVPLVIGAWWWRRQTREVRRLLAITAAALTIAVGTVSVVLYFIPSPTPSGWRSAAPWRASWQQTDAVDGVRVFRVQDGNSGSPWLRTSFRRPLGFGDGQAFLVLAQHRGAPAAVVVSDDVGNVVTATALARAGWQLLTATLPIDARATRIFVQLRALSADVAQFDAVQVYLGGRETLLVVSNPSAEAALPLLGQGMLTLAELLGVRGQAMQLIWDYRANITALGERLPQAVAFVQQSFWGKFGIFARAPNPTVSVSWVVILAIGFGVALAFTLHAIRTRQPDPDGAALLALSLVGLGLLLAQTFAPLLSFAAEGKWLPQGRYLFVGMSMLAVVPSTVPSMPGLRAPTCVFSVIVSLVAAQFLTLYPQVSTFFAR